jgi:hypothetical protein
MEKELYLDDEERSIFEEFYRACLDKKTSDKLKNPPPLGGGFFSC